MFWQARSRVLKKCSYPPNPYVHSSTESIFGKKMLHVSNAQQSSVPATALCFFVFLMLKRLFFEPWNVMKNRWKWTKNQPKINQKWTTNQSKIVQNRAYKILLPTHSQGLKRTAKDWKNPPADAQPSFFTDAQPRIYEIFLPTPRARNNEKIR